MSEVIDEKIKKKRLAQWKYKRTEKGQITQSKYYASKAKKEATKKWQQNPKNKIKRAAHQRVFRAIKNGKMKRGTCVVCRSRKAFAHHDNYFEPLNVTWLCNLHHGEIHRAMKER